MVIRLRIRHLSSVVPTSGSRHRGSPIQLQSREAPIDNQLRALLPAATITVHVYPLRFAVESEPSRFRSTLLAECTGDHICVWRICVSAFFGRADHNCAQRRRLRVAARCALAPCDAHVDKGLSIFVALSGASFSGRSP